LGTFVKTCARWHRSFLCGTLFDIDPDIEEAWAAKVERRNAEIESGAVSLIPGPEALAKLKAEFR